MHSIIYGSSRSSNGSSTCIIIDTTVDSVCLQLILQGLAHSSVDVKVVACDVCAELMSPADGLLTSVIPLLLQNGREKNTALRTSVDHALINLVQGDVHLKVQFHILGKVSSSFGVLWYDVIISVL